MQLKLPIELKSKRAGESAAEEMRKTASLSECGAYRYSLTREWNGGLPKVLFIGLNPSTADADRDDNTSRICINYAKRWGFGGMILCNLFAYRSTDPAALKKVADPIGPSNDFYIEHYSRGATLTICAWTAQGNFRGRAQRIIQSIRDPHCLVQLKDGSPGHPLYKRASLTPTPLDCRKILNRGC